MYLKNVCNKLLTIFHMAVKAAVLIDQDTLQPKKPVDEIKS